MKADNKQVTKNISQILTNTSSDTAKPKGYEKACFVNVNEYTLQKFINECSGFLYPLKGCETLEAARATLIDRILHLRMDTITGENRKWHRLFSRSRDCSRAFISMCSRRSEKMSDFSVTQALWDIAREVPRDDLHEGFFAEMIHFVWALESRTMDHPFYEQSSSANKFKGREAAIIRSNELDQLWKRVESKMNLYKHGLEKEIISQRTKHKKRILENLGGNDEDWDSWKWQTENVAKSAETLKKLVALSNEEENNIKKACTAHLPFGVTPFYLSLMNNDGDLSDKSLRAQVFPPTKYVDQMTISRGNQEDSFDFMGEGDTSPIDLITRRYPSIVILKPFNTCPQICVYCQRNWEIDEVLAPNAMAPWKKIEAAVKWIGEHPAVHEVLITGGDPLLLDDNDLERILKMVCALPTIARIRIGTRTPVTLPMRFTEKLTAMLGRFRDESREIALVTHVQHPYEINPHMAQAIQKLRVHGINTYNQMVYTFYSSRRFEGALLRRLLKKIGIDPYYTFLPKGKSETDDYRVPISRLLQEESEETRLLPGLTRTDESVYNVPRLGKNYLRASQHRDLVAILGDGTRMYEFHPWEKNIVDQMSYLGESVSILKYLQRLEEETNDNAWDYESIWYYF